MTEETRTIIQVPLGKLVPHDANMRQLFPIGPMAELTLQMIARGYDADKPMLVQKMSGRGKRFRIIRGHRRRMARAFSLFLIDQDGNNDWLIDEVTAAWETAVAQHGDVIGVVSALLKKTFADVTVPAVIFQGDYKASLPALWSDNFGDDKPDLLGSAHSFRAGHEAGFSVKQIAGQTGQSESHIENLIALAGVDKTLAARIAGGELGLSLAPVLLTLDEARRSGAVRFILHNDSAMLTVARLVRAIRRMKEWGGFPEPLTVSAQSHRNVARALENLWASRLDEDAGSAWESVFAFFYNSDADYQEPYTSIDLVVNWLVAFGVIGTSERTSAFKKLGAYLPTSQVSCGTCPVWQLPEKILQIDLISPLLYCRHQALRGNVDNCLHGLGGSDPFHVRVPSAWGDLPGVHGGDTPRPYVDSFDGLLEAYAARAELEKKRREEEERILSALNDEAETSGDTAVPASGGSDDTAEAPPPEPEGERPIDVMRGKISTFIALQELMDGATHPCALVCAGCANRLESSPTADDTVPHCAVAERLSNVTFEKIVAVDDNAAFPEIPVCRQWMPNDTRTLEQNIPAYPGKFEIDRRLMLAQIKRLADRKGYGRHPFEWVVGTSGDRTNWFAKTLDEEQGNLSDAQVFMLLLLATTESERSDQLSSGRKFYIPESATNPVKWVRVEWKLWDFDEV